MTQPSQSSGPEATRKVLIRMSPEAAERLSEACRWATYRAEVMDDPATSPQNRERAEQAHEWLDWGWRWLTYDGARA